MWVNVDTRRYYPIRDASVGSLLGQGTGPFDQELDLYDLCQDDLCQRIGRAAKSNLSNHLEIFIYNFSI